MSVIWGEARKRVGAHALSEIEVDEVSLVDRPATGKRFVLFKRRGSVLPVLENDTNICAGPAPETVDLAQRLSDVEAMQKRADEALGEVSRLQAVAALVESRLAALEAGRPARQSTDPAPGRGLWAGVL